MKASLCVILSACIILPSCGLLKKERQVESVKVQQPVGIIDRVDTEEGYVFIRRYRAIRLRDGEIMESKGSSGRVANLIPTGEKLGERIAADIKSGEVVKGDAVYIREITSSESASERLGFTPDWTEPVENL